MIVTIVHIRSPPPVLPHHEEFDRQQTRPHPL